MLDLKKKLNRFVTVLLYANNYIVYASSSSSSSSSFSSSPSPRKGKIVIKGKDLSKRRVGEGGCWCRSVGQIEKTYIHVREKGRWYFLTS